MYDNLRKQWNDTCLSAGITSITPYKAAQIMAVLMHLGNNEAMVMNQKFIADVKYIQQRYNLNGGLVPDKEFVKHFKVIEKELEQSLKNNIIPEWAKTIFSVQYEITLFN